MVRQDPPEVRELSLSELCSGVVSAAPFQQHHIWQSYVDGPLNRLIWRGQLLVAVTIAAQSCGPQTPGGDTVDG